MKCLSVMSCCKNFFGHLVKWKHSVRTYLFCKKFLWKHALFSRFLSLISPAPKSCEAFRLLQDLWVFLKFFQLRRVPEGLGHQDFPELLSYVISCVIGSRGHLPHLQGPQQFSFKKSRGFFYFFLCENLESLFQKKYVSTNDFFSFFFLCYWNDDISKSSGV